MGGKLFMDFTVILHEAEEGSFWVEVPSLPGCFSQGETVDEALRNVKKAIRSHVEALKEDGQPVPKNGEYLMGRVTVPV